MGLWDDEVVGSCGSGCMILPGVESLWH